MSEPWPVIERETEYETGWYRGGYDLVQQPDGSTKRYYWAELAPAVVIVALDGPDILFVEQYRPTVRTHHLELPAGIVEDGEGFIEAGRRELQEETGYLADEVALIQRYHVATGVLRHERGVVVATDLVEREVDHDSNEFLTVRRVDRNEAIDLARREPANDASLSGLLLAAEDGYLG